MSLSEKLQWILTADASGAVKGFQQAGDAADKNLKTAEGGSAKLSGQLTKTGAVAVAFAGVAGVALIKVAGSFEDLALKSGQMADATGLSVEQASRWIEVSGDMGIGADTIESAIGKMNKTLGGTPQKFADLGIEIARTKTGAEDVNGTFINTIERLNQIQDPAERATAAASIFGKGWQGSAELLKLSTTDIKAALQSVSDQKVINPEELASAKTYRDNLDQLKDSAENLGLAIGKSAAPVIGDLASGLSKIVDWGTKADTATGGLIGKFAAMATVGVGLLGTLSLVAGQAIKMRDRFTVLGDDGERSLTKTGIAAKGLGIGLGVAAIAMAAYTIQQNLNASNNKNFTTSLDAITRAADDQAVAITTNLIQAWKWADDAKPEDLAKRIAKENLAAAIKVRDLALANSEYRTKLEATGVTTDMLTSAINDEVEAQKKSKEATDKATATADAATSSIDDLTTSTAGASAATAYAQNVQDEATRTTEALAAATKDATDKANANAKAVADQTAKLQDLYGVEYNAVTAKYAYADATNKTNTDVATFNATLVDHKAKQSDVEGAYKTATDSIINQSEQYATLNGATLGSEGAISRQIESLKAQRDTLAPDSPLRVFLDQYIKDLENIPSNVSTIMDLHISSGQVTTAAGDVIGKRFGKSASGRDIPVGEGLTLVGEQGPELISSPGSAVYNASETAAMLGARRSGPLVWMQNVSIHKGIEVDALAAALNFKLMGV